jgi:hypothetical protein
MQPTMQLKNARYVRESGYPILEVEISIPELGITDKLARITLEQKRTTYEAGLIFLGSDWEEDLPKIEFENFTTLEGFIRDPELLKLFDDFGSAVSSGRFQPGAISL